MNARRKKTIITILVILCLLLALAAAAFVFLFNKGADSGSQPHGISFREDAITVEKYETYTLELLGAENKEIEWKSNDEAVATVENGVVCGWKKGHTQILAYVDDAEVSCNVTVQDNQYVPVIELGERDGLTMGIGGTYSLQPVLYYNGNAYEDVEFTYSSTADAAQVDENGLITAAAEGEALVCVQGTWRNNVVDAAMEVLVIDVSTSIEVSDKVFDIYLNGRSADYPSSADIGISIFDKDAPVEQKDAAVVYTELIMEGDTAGAATIENGVAYAAKIGTTHFVAEYTPADGEAVRSAVFTVNVHESPYDTYMKPIEGAEYSSFIEPLSALNSVEWDEKLGAFHLINKVADPSDARCFIFSRDYIENILKYTNAKSIVFEVKSDGISSGGDSPDQVIYQGFYPQWYDGGDYQMYFDTTEWQEIEIFFEDIPLDQEGERKAIMLLSSLEGMYIRNIRPRTEGSFLTMDLELTTLGGRWDQDIEIGAFPLSYEGSINGYLNRQVIKAGVKTTVKYRLDDFLEDGKVPGFGIVVFGGPEWNTELADGTFDRHTLKITNLRVTGEQNYSLDLSTASWASGTKDTGFTDANGSGVPYYEDGALIIENGYRYDGHKITLDSVDPKERTNICFDMLLTTLGESADYVDICFYPYGFEGDIYNDFTDKIAVKAGKETTVKLDLDKYLVDGKFSGIGFAVFGGPEWNTELEDGTMDRHNVVISGVRLEGKQEKTFNLDDVAVTTGFANANGGGAVSVADGTIKITNGYRYDGHMIAFTQVDTYLKLDVLVTTLSNSTENIGIRFYPYGFQGDVHSEQADTVNVIAGTKTTVKLDLSKYLVDGKFNGIGVAIFGGPEWNTELEDGTYDRHNVVISNMRLEGKQEQTFDLNGAAVVTGFANSNAGGTAAVVDGTVVFTNGYRYDGHMISFVGGGQSDPSQPGGTEPPEEDADTYISMDMLLTTVSNSTEKIGIRFYPANFAGNVHETYVAEVYVTAGTKSTVKLNYDHYLVDGAFTGIGFAVFGGPEWNTEIGDGVYDRHNIIISDVRLEGELEKTVDLSNATVATGFGSSNAGGAASVVNGKVYVVGGYRYDGHMINLNEADTYLKLDMLITTLGNSTDPVEVRFYPANFAGSVHENYTDKLSVTAGARTTVKLDMSKYLVDGELTGIGFAIFGGPEWNTELADGSYDRHSVTVSKIRLEGELNQTIDLSNATVVTGFGGANTGGTAAVTDGIVTVIGGYRYDGHMIRFDGENGPEATEPGETQPEGTQPQTTAPAIEYPQTYISFDMLITTLGNSAEPVEVRFYPYGFQGNVHSEYTDKLTVTAGTQMTVQLDINKYLVDGKYSGIGVGIFGGPEWNSVLEDGTADKHAFTISNMRLEGELEKSFDLNQATVATGFGGSNSGGIATVADGVISVTDGIRYDGHMISLNEADTYLKLDMLITTLGNSTGRVDVCFYPYGFEGDIYNEYTDKLSVTAGTATTVKLDLSKYLVDDAFTGIGFAVFGGPEWNTQLEDGTYDRHSVTVSNIRLEGELEKTFDLSTATVASGFANANSGGAAAVVDGTVTVIGGYRYDGHMIRFDGENGPETTEPEATGPETTGPEATGPETTGPEATEPEGSEPETTEPPVEETDTYISFDMLITTLGNSTEPVEVRFYTKDFAGSVHAEYTDMLTVTAGTQTTVRLELNKYLVDGELTGIGVGIFGGPEWNSVLEDGTPDKHAFTISNMRLEGEQEKTIDLRTATVVTGFGGSNSGGIATVVDGVISVTDGIRYDGHMIDFNEVDTYLKLDVLITTLGNSADAVDVGFFPYSFQGDINNYIDKIPVTAGSVTTVALDLNKYLVDGELPGIGFAIFGGPEWNTQLEDGTYDRHSITISGIRLEGQQEKTIDLSNAQVTTGTNGTGYTNANGSGAAAIVDGAVVITNGFRFDGHKIDFNAETEPETTEPEEPAEGLTVTGPQGTVYPYQDCVKEYLMDENIDIMSHYVAGTEENGDASIAPVRITWSDTNDSNVTKYVVEYAMSADYSNAVTVVKDTQLTDKSIEVYNLYKASTYYVRVTAYAADQVLGQAEATFQTTDLGPRIMSIDGLYNVRDLGGYTTADGKTTVQGLIFRGSEMDGGNGIELTEAGNEYMSNVLGIQTDLDLRGYTTASPISSATKKAVGINAYTDAFTQTELYAQIFSTLADVNNYPVYIHCMGGADRTGTVCYLINALLGVSEEDLIRDYEMTSYSIFGVRTKDFDVYKFPEFVEQLKSYEGDTLAEKTENYMLSIGVTEEEIFNIRAIMLGEETKTVVSAQEAFNAYEDSELVVSVSGSKEIASVTVDGNEVAFTATETGFVIAAQDMPETLAAGTVYGAVTFADGETAQFRFEYSNTPAYATSICLDMLITTLGNSTDPIEVRFYPYDYNGSVHNSYTDLVTVTAGEQTTVKLDLSKYLVDGELTGIGFAIFGGPEWNTELEPGVYDRHTVTISSVKLEGEQSAVYDLSKSVWAGGQNGTGYTDANGAGTATVGSSIVITGGFRYDGHKISLVEDTNTLICMDMLITTLGNSSDPIEVRFYSKDFTGSVHNGYTDMVTVTAGEQTTVKLDASKYLVDGKLTGIGVGIFGGPEWNSTLSSGAPDKHAFTISGIRLEGAEERTIDMRSATVTTGMTGSNAGGIATVVDGSVSVTNGIRYDAHMITFNEVDTYICMDMLLTTLGNSSDPVEIGFFPYDFEGDINNATDKLIITAGEQTTVKLDMSKYLVDGELTGIGFAIFGGPEWNTQLGDGTYDRHTVTISGIRLEGQQEKTIDLSNATVATGTNGTGYTNANGSGAASVADGSIVITGGFRYDGHKITFGSQEEKTYICLDMLITTLSNSTDAIDVCFYPHGFSGNAHTEHTDKLSVTAGTKTAVKLELDPYLVDGQFTGIGFAIFGGPEWNTQMAGGAYDRHSVVVSNMRLEGGVEKTIDLSGASVATGFANSNSGGTAAVADNTIVVTGGYRYDGHMITFSSSQVVRKRNNVINLRTWLIPANTWKREFINL